MKRIFWFLFFASTTGGFALPFLSPGTWSWWDSLWIFSFFVAVYADLANETGLSTARVSSGIVIVGMAVLLGLSGISGWPLGPLLFTERAGLRIGGTIPLELPLLAFGLLTVSWRTAAMAFPGAGRTLLPLATAGAFLFSIINGLSFFTNSRIWWVWNPAGGAGVLGRAVFSLVFLAAVSFALTFAYPVVSSVRKSWRNTAFPAWFCINALFLVANCAKFPR